VLNQLNRRMLLHNISHRYAAVEYACFDPSAGVLRIVSAGMEGPLHMTAGHEMALQGLPPGMFLSATYESVTLQLQRGDSIVFFSDGLSDTKNHGGRLLWTERIREVCRSTLRATPQEQLNAITTSVKAHADRKRSRTTGP
jgi:phosphoserine phosphatase RsbU/P